MGDYGYDDGLVHGHLWASKQCERPQAQHERGQHLDATASADDGYDDGLVHNHGWARSA
jgi:hypothetical protein